MSIVSRQGQLGLATSQAFYLKVFTTRARGNFSVLFMKHFSEYCVSTK